MKTSLETREVLAACYPSHRLKPGNAALLTHGVVVNDSGEATAAMCNRVRLHCLADPGSLGEIGKHQPPTCPTCLRVWNQMMRETTPPIRKLKP